MLFYSQGTVFNAGTDAVVNTVNCSGVMGTGLALEFRLRYPRMFEEYQRRARAGAIRPGFVDYYVDESGLIIVNFPTKNHFARPSKLEWIERGLKHFVSTYGSWSFQSIAFSKLGTDHGRLNWKDVKTLMEAYLRDLRVDVIICLDELPYAQGVERRMVDYLNSVSLVELAAHVKLSRSQLEAINAGRPYVRFWHLRKTRTIGLKTYEAVFAHVYAQVASTARPDRQLKLFD